MTKETLESTGYIVVDGKVVELLYRDYLNDFDDSEMKLWPESIFEDGKDEKYFKFEIWSQKINRKAERCNWLGEFDSMEEAELEIYDRQKWYISEKNWDAPIFWNSEEDAEAEIIDFMADSMQIAKNVAESIYRKKKIVDAKRELIAKANRARIDKENEERKSWLAIEVPKEADSIIIDEQFKKDLTNAMLLFSKGKSLACESALSNLLKRTGAKITTDFWQVLRILKAKALKN